jgi:poly-gamma-glutamate synthesis protein (capsule biosynthesis protein)
VPAAELERTLVERVRALRTRADAVVVWLHWGAEGSGRPGGRQRALARALVEAGAAVVAGHHAHVLQPVEPVGGAVVLYGLGNLVSDMGGRARQSGLFRVRLDEVGGALVAVEAAMTPVTIGDDGAPRIDGPERRVWVRAAGNSLD